MILHIHKIIVGEQGPTLPISENGGATEYDPSKYNITTHHLTEGEHIYPLSLSLPSNITGSFHTDKGDSIVYDITVTIWSQQQPPVEVSKSIHVNCVFNLNAEPELMVGFLFYNDFQYFVLH